MAAGSSVQGSMNGPSKGAELRVRAYADGKLVAEEIVACGLAFDDGRAEARAGCGLAAGQALSLRPDFGHSPGRPGVGLCSQLFGLRKITIAGNRFLINDRPVFHRLVLDQGFYPEGIYTAPSDEALRRDIELSMAAGFNGARLHQKVFEPRAPLLGRQTGLFALG